MTLRDHGWCVAAGAERRRLWRAVRVIAPIAFVSLAVLLPFAARAQLPTFDRVLSVQSAGPIDDVELIDHDGRPFRLSALRGKVAFVLFGFTHCPDVCPVAMERLRELHESGAVANGNVAYVMISVDGERDTPAAMKAFVAKFSQDFIGLTAEPSRVTSVANQFSARFFKGGHNGHGSGYDVAHSAQLFVLDPAGRLRAEVYGASLEAMAGLTQALLADAK
jgi:protein SCO1/2